MMYLARCKTYSYKSCIARQLNEQVDRKFNKATAENNMFLIPLSFSISLFQSNEIAGAI